MPSPFIWFHNNGKNPRETKAFFESLLDFKSTEGPNGMTMLATGAGPFAALGSKKDRYGDQDEWIPFVAVEDVDAATKRAVGLGASLVREKSRGPAGDGHPQPGRCCPRALEEGVNMTVVKNTIHIEAPLERVWQALTKLDALHEYDPGVAKSVLRTAQRAGIGADRQCDIKAGGWFRERVTVWEPASALEFTLYDCTLPVRRLRHHYALRAENGGTRIDQTQEYTLKYGPSGRSSTGSSSGASGTLE